MGFKFTVFSTAEIPVTRLNNIIHLEDYYRPFKPRELDEKIIDLVTSHPGIEFRRIVQELKLTGKETDQLNSLIAHRKVYVCLDTDPIAPNYTAKVYPSAHHARIRELERVTSQDGALLPGTQIRLSPGKQFQLHNEQVTIVAQTAKTITVASSTFTRVIRTTDLVAQIRSGVAYVEPEASTNPALEALNNLDPGPQERLLAKYESIKAFLEPLPGESLPKKTRSQRRYLRAFRSAQRATGCGLYGLIERKNRGNTKSRLNPRVLEIISSVISEVYLTLAAPSQEFVWGEIQRRCNAENPKQQAPSRQTISAFINRIPEEAAIRLREGARAGYSKSAPVWQDEWDGISIDGEFAWACCHIDHTQLDIETPPTPDGLHLGRPWITIMLSPRQRRPIAFVISYDSPSYRSCMAVLRDCVRRHGRFPRVITVDGGSDFRSNYFEMLLAKFEVHKKMRPPVKPRFGAVLERFNCTFTTSLLHNMPGNTKATKNVRTIDKTNAPQNFAMLSLAELYDCIDGFLFDFMDNKRNSLTGISPRQKFETDLALGGAREFKAIIYDSNFLILTMPSTKREVAKVHRSGVRLHSLTYWAAELRNPNIRGKSYPVRYDPDDFSHIFLLIEGKWVECRCRQYQGQFIGLTEREIKFASAELLSGLPFAEKRRAISAAALAQFFHQRGITPTVLTLRKRANENLSVRKIKMAIPLEQEKAQQIESPASLDSKSPTPPILVSAVPSRRKPKQYTIGFNAE